MLKVRLEMEFTYAEGAEYAESHSTFNGSSITQSYTAGVGSAVLSPPNPRTRNWCCPYDKPKYQTGVAPQYDHAAPSKLHSRPHKSQREPDES